VGSHWLIGRGFGTGSPAEGFLKTVLDIPPEDFGRLTVIDPFLKRRWKKDKQGVVDIRLAMTGGQQV
jgi:hypothetical protein